MWCIIFFFFKQKTAYEMRISDWSSDVCSSDLHARGFAAEVGFDGLVVDADFAGARLEEHARGRSLATARAVLVFDVLGHVGTGPDQILRGCGCCAVCGCSLPTYTFSLRTCASPSVPRVNKIGRAHV